MRSPVKGVVWPPAGWSGSRGVPTSVGLGAGACTIILFLKGVPARVPPMSWTVLRTPLSHASTPVLNAQTPARGPRDTGERSALRPAAVEGRGGGTPSSRPGGEGRPPEAFLSHHRPPLAFPDRPHTARLSRLRTS